MTKNSIGQFISALRKANGMTQQEVADRLCVSNKAVSRWERDECAPDISLLPAIAEMFEVTCDELLKGERITTSVSQEKKVQKVEKQVNNLINRTLSGFKTLVWISLAISAVGLICMFGISYAFYRPQIGFAVMLLFEVCAFVVAVLAVSRTKDVKADNELFQEADKTWIDKFDSVLGSYSFVAFFAILAVVMLSFPLILFQSDFVESVLAIQSYFMVFFVGNVLILTLIYLKCKAQYMVWVTGKTIQKNEACSNMCIMRKMNTIQIGAVALAGVLFVCAPYLDFSPRDGFDMSDVAVLVGLICLVACIVCFFVFFTKHKEERKIFILPGIRNICLIPAALIVSEVHYMGWQHVGYMGWQYVGEEEAYSVSELERYDVWQTEYFWYAVALAVFVYVVFSLVQEFLYRKSR